MLLYLCQQVREEDKREQWEIDMQKDLDDNCKKPLDERKIFQ